MAEQSISRRTSCPVCGRIVVAFLTEMDNGKWHFTPHLRLFKSPQNEGGPCPSEDGVWRLTGRGGAPSGGWVDYWKRPDSRGL